MGIKTRWNDVNSIIEKKIRSDYVIIEVETNVT